jgi:hypothetical protein
MMSVRCDVAAGLNCVQHSLKRIFIAGVKDVYFTLAIILSCIACFGIDEVSVDNN